MRSHLFLEIHEHNEANLNQFKFISHLIVSNQKDNYRMQSQAKEEGERTNAGTDALNPSTITPTLCDDSRQQKQQETEPEMVQPSQEEEQKQKSKPIQHQLWQQQDLRPYPHSVRKPSSDCTTSKSERTTSLPNLHQMTSFGNHRRNIRKGSKRTATHAQHAVNETPKVSTTKRKSQRKSQTPACSSTPVRNH